MNQEDTEARRKTGGGARWGWPAAVFAGVLVAQWVLVAVAGTDIPFHDQWNIEGQWLYPAWRDGSIRAAEFFQPFNEHRILWTHLLNLGLFTLNGQWDPLVQQSVGAMLRALVAAGLAAMVMRASRCGAVGSGLIAATVTVAFLPHLAWHNALWGFQSHVYFSLLFALVTLGLLGAEEVSGWRRWVGLAAGGAALLAMGAGAFGPVALLGLAAVRAIERRRIDAAWWRGVWPAGVLLAAAVALRVDLGDQAKLHAATVGDFFNAFGRALAWPHTAAPWAAVVMNAPIAWLVGARLARRRRAAAGEDLVLLLGGWAIVSGAAAAWARGGGGEFWAGVPSRYGDFLVLLPLANLWCVVTLAGEAGARWRASGRWVAIGWGAFLAIGWLGLSVEMMQRIILPRMRDREAPVRLAVAFQRTGDAAVFAGQPRLLVPHPNPASVRTVLDDPRMRGALPPSLQPERPMGPWSRAVRWLLGR
jgi:hypothetical protein